MNSDAAAGPPREPRAPVSPAPQGLERVLFIAALALAALLGNRFSLPLAFGVDFLFGSIAVMLALARLGTGAGLVVALVGGAYTWLFWGHPYALLIFLAEAAAVGRHRDRARRRGLTPPPLAVSAALFWLLLGIPLALLAYRVTLGLGWIPTLLIVAKQSLNGILNAALADLVLVGGALLTRQKSALSLRQVLFGVLLAAMLVPSILVNAWENRDLKDRLEAAQATSLRFFGELAIHQLMADARRRGADPAAREAQLAVMRSALVEILPPSFDPQLRLEPGPAPVPQTPAGATAAPLSRVLGSPVTPGQVIPTAVPGLVLILPSGRYPSRVGLWRAAVYRLDIPALAPPARGDAGSAADTPPQDFSLVMQWRAAPLVDQVQGAATRLLVLLLGVTLLGLVVAAGLSLRIVRPLRQLAAGSRALPAAIRGDSPWPAPVPGLLAETGELADAVAGMAESLAASFRALSEERDQREALHLLLAEQEERYRTLYETMAEGVVYHGADGAITDANPAAQRLLGLSLEALRGRDSLDPRWQAIREDGLPFLGEEHPAMVALRTGQAQGGAVMGILNPQTNDTRWLLVHARPQARPGESRPYRVFASFADITRLKRTEHRLRAILEVLPHGIVEVDPLTRRLLWCSGSMLRLLGYGPTQWQGLKVEDLHPVESLPRVLAEFERMARADLAPALDLPCRRRDGSLFYCKVSPGLARLGTETILVAFFTDVTAELQARLALTRYNAQLEDLVDAISLPLPLAHQVGTLLSLGCRSLGVGAAVLVMMDEERGHRVLFAAPDDTRDGVARGLERAFLDEVLTHPGSPVVLGPERLPGAALRAGLRSCVALAFAGPRADGRTDTLVLSLWGPEPTLDLGGPGHQILRLIAQQIAAVRYQEQIQRDLMHAKGEGRQHTAGAAVE